MFKQGVFTDEISQDFERACEIARQFNLDGVEIRSVWSKPPQELDADDKKKMKAILEDKGLAVCSIASPFFKCELDSDEDYQKHLDILRRCIDLGKTFDCNMIRGFTFWRRGDFDAAWPTIIEKYAEPVKILEQADAVIAMENESSCYVGNGADTARFVEAVSSDRVKACWDPCNELSDPRGSTPYPDGYDAIKPYMIHMHVKDAVPGEGCCEVGEGVIDYHGQFKALIEDGYEGYASLETHWRPKRLEGRVVRTPGGAEFSEGGEMPSIVCLEAIQRIIGEVREELGK
jgi:sugar phosphate isomerase/epimerase